MDEKIRGDSIPNEFVESVKARIYERARSPFIGAFVIAWFFINFRVIYALISAETYADAFEIIDQKIWTSHAQTAFYALLLPAIYVFLYMLVVPVLERWAVTLWTQGKLKVRSARVAAEDGAMVDAKTIKDYERHIQVLNSQNDSRIVQIREENAKEAEELRRRAEYCRERACESLIPENDARRLLQNMRPVDRTIIWLSNSHSSGPGGSANTAPVLENLRIFHPDFPARQFYETISFLSKECYIKQSLPDVVVDTSYSLSVRGNDLVRIMREIGLVPKAPDQTGQQSA